MTRLGTPEEGRLWFCAYVLVTKLPALRKTVNRGYNRGRGNDTQVRLALTELADECRKIAAICDQELAR